MRVFGSFAGVALAALVSSGAQAATFCLPGSLGYTWVRLGQCAPQGGGCKTLPRMTLTRNGQWSCGTSSAPVGHRYSFPARGTRYYGRLEGGTYYFSPNRR